MSTRNLLRQNESPGQILRNFSGNQVSLRRGHDGIFIGVLFHDILIAVANKGKNGFIRSVGLAHQRPGITVNDIGLRQLEFPQLHQLGLNHILNIFYQVSIFLFLFNIISNFFNIFSSHSISCIYSFVSLLNGNNDFASVKIYC